MPEQVAEPSDICEALKAGVDGRKCRRAGSHLQNICDGASLAVGRYKPHVLLFSPEAQHGEDVVVLKLAHDRNLMYGRVLWGSRTCWILLLQMVFAPRSAVFMQPCRHPT